MTSTCRAAFALLLASCAGPATPRPDDMSAAAHRREAAQEREEARRARADRAFPEPLRPIVPGGHAAILPSEELRTGESQLSVAEARAQHARLHEMAAAELERLEEVACAGLAFEARAACPLATGAGVVVALEDGVEIRFNFGAPVDAVQRRMRCHNAYARTRGLDAAGDCPLAVKGLRIERTHPRILRLVSADPAAAAELRRGARGLVPAGVPVP